MQPKTDIRFDPKTFNRLKRTIQQMSEGHQQCLKDPGYATPLPVEISLQLTNACNLRCKHCFQWNQAGLYREMDEANRNQSLDFDLVARIIHQSASARPNLYLWGGEPLSYPEWEPLSHLLEANPFWTVLCTNGIDLDKRLESILRISENLAILLSLDGLQDENDALRGRGTYQKVQRNLDELFRLKQRGVFKGEISIHCVIHEAVVTRMVEFLEFFEARGVNTVYFCFPWYISPASAARMDEYFTRNFQWLRQLPPETSPSWHSYRYHLGQECIPALLEQLNRVSERTWHIRVRLQPALDRDEIAPFILGEEIQAQKRSLCLAVSQRMNVLPDGQVTVCKLFPEFAIGDLHQENVSDLWQKPAFRRAREILHQGLMPACTKCVLLYLHGI